MGKIRIKTLGIDEIEKQQKKEAEKRRQIKKEKTEKGKIKAEKPEEKDEQISEPEVPKKVKTEKTEKKKEKEKVKTISKKGKKYNDSLKLVDKTKQYSLEEAVKLIKKMAYAKFDETVEIHMNILEKGLKGEAVMPHGTGKEVRAVVADDKVIDEIKKGNINFDVLISTPSYMSKLVPYAKILGPKGLMPNPKNGTITDDPKKALEKFKGGGIRYKSEAKFPIIHQAVGKVSFSEKNLSENIKAFVSAIQKTNIKEIYISSTMSPSVHIKLDSI